MLHSYPVVIDSDQHALIVRSIRPDDGPRLQAFMHSLSDESRYFRFLDAIRELPPALLRYFVELDFDYDMALVAVLNTDRPDETVIGVARYFGDEGGRSCEFAIAVADAWHHHGIGHRLMCELFDCARAHGYERIHGDVLGANVGMLKLMQDLGFTVRTSLEDPALRIVERWIPGLEPGAGTLAGPDPLRGARRSTASPDFNSKSL